MRTTITKNPDTEALLRHEVERTGLSFKVVLNQAIKRALGRRASGVQLQPLFAAPFPPELNQQSFNRLAAEWEDEDTVHELGSRSHPTSISCSTPTTRTLRNTEQPVDGGKGR